MRITEGIRLVLAPTQKFHELVAFFRDAMGLTVVEEGIPATDTQFARYAIVQMPNGVALEIVEPKEGVARLYTAPIVSITVGEVAEARQELETRRTEFVTPIFDTGEGWGWTYFRAPGGTIYQLQGPYGDIRPVYRRFHHDTIADRIFPK